MKKLLGILVLGLLWCNVGFAEEKKPKYSYSLNDNIIVHGWKIKSSKIIKTSTGSPLELYTLMKGKWILKCQIYISEDKADNICLLP